ncbi:Protein of unknown function [Gryllus bimaculatus]|nr:Protein of unknown function [Gryllus bimaculatus]
MLRSLRRHDALTKRGAQRRVEVWDKQRLLPESAGTRKGAECKTDQIGVSRKEHPAELLHIAAKALARAGQPDADGISVDEAERTYIVETFHWFVLV